MLKFKEYLNKKPKEKIPAGIIYKDRPKEKIPVAIIIKPQNKEIKENINDSLKEIDELHNELTKNENYSDQEKKEIKRYADSSFGLNANLLAKHHFNEEHGEHVHGSFPDKEPHHLPTLDKITKKPLKRPLTTYSGVSFDPRKIMTSDGRIHLPAFTSTSLDLETAKRFGSTDPKQTKTKHVIKFDLNPENQGAYIANHTELSSERELLLPRNSTITIHHSVPDEKDQSITVHHATVTHDTNPNDVERNPEHLANLPDKFHSHYLNNQNALSSSQRSKLRTHILRKQKGIPKPTKLPQSSMDKIKELLASLKG